MRVLLDHCVPNPLRELLAGHEVITAMEEGWESLRNGELLAQAAEKYDAFVTVGSDLGYQQDLTTLPLPVVVMVSVDIRIDALAELIPGVLAVLSQKLTRRVYVVPEGADLARRRRRPRRPRRKR